MATTVPYDPATSRKLGRARIIGQPISRVDGVAKVTGTATYAYEHSVGTPAAYGFIVGATIACGSILSIDSRAAERIPGVLLVLTHLNAPEQAPFGPPVVDNRMSRARPVLRDANVRFFGEPVAFVIAENFETARAAARFVKVTYAPETAQFDLESNIPHAYVPARVGPGFATDSALGNFEDAFANSAVQMEAVYRLGYQNHNPMEPHAALAAWEGDQLTVYASQQNIAFAHHSLAATLRLDPQRVRLISRYVGGGFGSKLPMNAEVVLAALGATLLRRPVKVAQTRQQMFSNSGHRPACQQRIRLSASLDGQLSGVAHEVWGQTARFDEFAEQVAVFTRSLYATPNLLTRHRLVPLDLQHGETMRAPGEAPGLLAFESAMDELAVALKIDPVELRMRNEPSLDPDRQVPFSSRRLLECLQIGARQFRWDQRPIEPASRREGRHCIGYGMAVGIRPNKIGKASARVVLRPTGKVTAQLDMTDLGTGSYTILSQVVAEVLGIDMRDVEVELGDSRFPATTGSGGSLGAGSSGSALYNACLALRDRICQSACSDQRSPLYGRAPVEITLRDGRLWAGHVSESLSSIADRAQRASLEAEGSVLPGNSYQRFSQHSFAAYFAEVEVDVDTAEIGVRRMLGVFDVGRILNAKTARSQLIGGMIWGISAAIHEEGVVDARYGNFVNNDLAGYHFPTHADIAGIEAVILDGSDENSNPIGSKGVGELGICGSGAAIANAVFNATGVRVRSFPITLESVLMGWLRRPGSM
jgi:xanthine dehydrogenase YagR molybdenum-binding subunit